MWNPLAFDKDLNDEKPKIEVNPLMSVLASSKEERALEISTDVAKAEQDRETNLNARGAAVASVAGIVVSVSSAIAKTGFQNPDWTDWTKLASVGLFVVALFLSATSMLMAVLGVLRPKRGKSTKNFLGETLVNLWIHGYTKDYARATKEELNAICLHRYMSTMPEWHYRNRAKARWLRRAWVFLALGIAGLALAAVFVLAETLGATPPWASDRFATFEYWWILTMVAVAAVGSWALLSSDVIRAGWRGQGAAASAADSEAIAAALGWSKDVRPDQAAAAPSRHHDRPHPVARCAYPRARRLRLGGEREQADLACERSFAADSAS